MAKRVAGQIQRDERPGRFDQAWRFIRRTPGVRALRARRSRRRSRALRRAPCIGARVLPLPSTRGRAQSAACADRTTCTNEVAGSRRHLAAVRNSVEYQSPAAQYQSYACALRPERVADRAPHVASMHPPPGRSALVVTPLREAMWVMSLILKCGHKLGPLEDSEDGRATAIQRRPDGSAV